MQRTIVVLTMILLSAAGLKGEVEFEANLVGQIFDYWANSCGVDVENGIAYLTTNQTGLKIIDVSDPENPVHISDYRFDGSITKVIADGDVAYIYGGTHNGSYLWTLNISDPLNIEQIGSLSGIYLLDMVKSGDYLYARYNDEILVINVSDPTNPELANIVPFINIRKINIKNGYLYVLIASDCLKVLNLSFPENPILTDSLELEFYSSYNDLEVYDYYAYLIDNNNGFTIVDVSNSYDIFACTSYDIEFGVNSTGIEDGRLYLASDSLHIWSINHPYIVFELSALDLEGYINDVCISENRLFTAAGSAGLNIVNVSDSLNPYLEATLGNYGEVTKVIRKDDYLYTVCGEDGLQVVDISEPANMTVSAVFETEGYVSDVDVSGDVAVLNDSPNGVFTLDVSDPGAPCSPGFIPYNCNSMQDIQIIGGYAYSFFANSSGSDFSLIKVIDIQTPYYPNIVCDLDRYFTCVQLVGDRLFSTGVFVTTFPDHYDIAVFNVFNPVSPQILYGLEFDYPLGSVSVSGDRGVVTGIDNYMVYFLDFSNPDSIIVTHEHEWLFSDALIHNDIILLGSIIGFNYSGYIFAYDVSDIYNPVCIDTLFVGGWIEEIGMDDEYIYVCDTYSLKLFEYSITSINTPDKKTMETFSLSPIYPNPFNDQTTISFNLDKSGMVKLGIFDILGRQVQTFDTGHLPLGNHELIWDGIGLSSGVYLIKLSTADGQQSAVRKAVLLK